jgi:hypothetical protein
MVKPRTLRTGRRVRMGCDSWNASHTGNPSGWRADWTLYSASQSWMLFQEREEIFIGALRTRGNGLGGLGCRYRGLGIRTPLAIRAPLGSATGIADSLASNALINCASVPSMATRLLEYSHPYAQTARTDFSSDVTVGACWSASRPIRRITA